nr:hypothetical protein [Tanacetum cinerariifolium]
MIKYLKKIKFDGIFHVGFTVTILNTKDHLGKFDGKADEGFFVGYSLNSKAFRVFNNRTRIVEENLHIRFSENTPNIAGTGLNWLFDIDALTKLMNYKPVVAGNQSNGNVGTKACDDAGKARMDTIPGKDYVDEDPRQESECKDQEKEDNVNSTNNVNVAGINRVNAVDPRKESECKDQEKEDNVNITNNMPSLEDISTFNFSSDHEDDDEMVDMNNLDTTIHVSPTLTTRIHKDHPLDQVIVDLHFTTQTRNMYKNLEEHGFVNTIHQEKTVKTFKTVCLLAFYHKKNPKRAIGTKWVFQNKKDERGIVIRNKARLVAQGHIQEEGFDYDVVFAPVARIEAIRLFLAYASFKDFVVYQMDVKIAFFYGKIKEEVYVCQPPGFKDLNFPNKVFKVEKALYGLYQALRAWYETLSTSQECKHTNGTQKPLLKDEDAKEVDVHMHRSMIGSLIYLISSRSDIMFAVCACARYQVNPKVSHLYAMKRIFRFVQVFRNNQLEGMSNHNRIYVTPPHTKKIFRNMKRVEKGFSGWETPLFPTMMSSRRNRKPRRKVTEVHQPNDPIKHVTDEVVNEEMDDSLERATTAATSLDVKQDRGERAQQEVEANISLIESWDDVQAKINADYQLAERLQAEE